MRDLIKTSKPDSKQVILIVKDCTSIYKGLDGAIGKPISYENYKSAVIISLNQNFLNPNGSNKIPENLIKNGANGMKKKSAPIERMEIEGDENYMPIGMLTMHSDKFRLKVRITSKTNKKKFKNSKGGEGEVFSIEMIDSNGDEIRGSFFNANSIKWFDTLAEGKVYSFENGSIRPPTYG